MAKRSPSSSPAGIASTANSSTVGRYLKRFTAPSLDVSANFRAGGFKNFTFAHGLILCRCRSSRHDVSEVARLRIGE